MGTKINLTLAGNNVSVFHFFNKAMKQYLPIFFSKTIIHISFKSQFNIISSSNLSKLKLLLMFLSDHINS